MMRSCRYELSMATALLPFMSGLALFLGASPAYTAAGL